MSNVQCGVFSFGASGGVRRFHKLTVDFAATRPWYQLERICDCEEQISMQDGSTLGKATEEAEPKRQWRGLGDLVADGIKAATFGLVKPCAGCTSRQETLNRWVPFR